MTIKLDARCILVRNLMIGAVALLALVLTVAVAQALTYQEAKSQGFVGQQADGYVGIVNPPGTPELQKLVADINLQRREGYQKIAAEKQIPLAQIEALSGEKLISRARSGEWVRGADGKWVRIP
jgi:hypothetical protein